MPVVQVGRRETGEQKAAVEKPRAQRSCKQRTDRQERDCAQRDSWRQRPDRPKDHRRHLRRDEPARRRRVQRQGSYEGRSERRLHGPLRRKNIVAAGYPGRCEIELAYAIGVPFPISINVDDRIERAIEGLRSHPGGHHPDARSQEADRPEHEQPRSLRSREVQAGANRSGGCAAEGGGISAAARHRSGSSWRFCRWSTSDSASRIQAHGARELAHQVEWLYASTRSRRDINLLATVAAHRKYRRAEEDLMMYAEELLREGDERHRIIACDDPAVLDAAHGEILTADA